MTEKNHGFDTDIENSRQSRKGEAIAQVVDDHILAGLRETLLSGRMIYDPTSGVVLTPEGEVKEIKDLTPEELAKNPHVKLVGEANLLDSNQDWSSQASLLKLFDK